MFINYTTRQLAAKIVYFGPALSGKTTNLKQIYLKTAPGSRGELVSLETDSDRTLFFDLLPIEVGVIGGFQTKFQLYTVPGQVHYESTRTLVLKGVDGLVFVADSQAVMKNANTDHFGKLVESLAKVDVKLGDVPLVLQYNKRDLDDIMPLGEMNALLNPRGAYPVVEAVAGEGRGVFETLKLVTKLTLKSIKQRIESPSAAAPPPKPAPKAEKPAPSPPPPPPPEPPVPRRPREENISFAALKGVPSESIGAKARAAATPAPPKTPVPPPPARPVAKPLRDSGSFLREEQVPLDELHPSGKGVKSPARSRVGTSEENEDLFAGVFDEPAAAPPPLPAEDEALAMEEAEAFNQDSPGGSEDIATLNFDEASEAEQTVLEQSEDFLQTRELDKSMGLPVRRVAVAKADEIEATLEELISMTLGKKRKKPAAAPPPAPVEASSGWEEAVEEAPPAAPGEMRLDKDANIRFPLRSFEGARAMRFDLVLDGEKPLRLRDAVVVPLENGARDARSIVLKLTLRVDAKK